jgi:phosphatidylglycerophosphatase A
VPPTILFGLFTGLGASSAGTATVMAVLVVGGSVGCVLCAPASMAARKVNDPGEVVADEFAGQALAFLVVVLIVAGPRSSWETLLLALGGFLAFRVFDIAKPWPIRSLERLPAGWGILADDLAAGLMAAICVCLAARLLAGHG